MRLVLVDASEYLEIDPRNENLVTVICLYKNAQIDLDDKQDKSHG
jgi:hypothetical protein